jgi:hypothetical protein
LRPLAFLPVFGAGEEIDKTRPDILAVLTPPESHHALARIGLQAAATFLRQPLTPTIQEATSQRRYRGSGSRSVANEYRS